MREQRRTRIGALLVMAGLLVQIAAAFFWSPAAFLMSAGIGLPLVLAGAIGLGLGVRGAVRAAREQGAGDGSR
jgi:hypothetical protein